MLLWARSQGRDSPAKQRSLILHVLAALTESFPSAGRECKGNFLSAKKSNGLLYGFVVSGKSICHMEAAT